MAISNDGTRLFVTGTSFVSGSREDWATVAYNAKTGAALWTKRYTRTQDSSDRAWALGVSPDGTKVFVTGETDGPGFGDFETIVVQRRDGCRVWSRAYGNAGLRNDEPTALRVSPDGTKVLVTGTTESAAGKTTTSRSRTAPARARPCGSSAIAARAT